MATRASGNRYRCDACGNLTRFEVTATRTTRAFHHYTVGGELSVEDVEVIAENLVSVICRWCGTGANVVVVDDNDDVETDGSADGSTAEPSLGSAGSDEADSARVSGGAV